MEKLFVDWWVVKIERMAIGLATLCLGLGAPLINGATGNAPPEQGMVDGDPALIEYVHALRRANIEKFPAGKLTAELRRRNAHRLSIRMTWAPERAIWDFARTYPMTQHDPSGQRVVERTQFEHLLFTGKEYLWYWPSEGGEPGYVTVLSPQQRLSRYEPGCFDLQPAKLWGGSFPSVRPWEELLSPHPKFPVNEVKRWVVRQPDSETVTVERQDLDGSLRVDTMSLVLGGNMIKSTYRGREMAAENEMEWVAGFGGFWLKRAFYWEKRTGQKRGEEEWRFTSFVPMDVAPAEFARMALRIAPGSIIDDQIRNRKHTEPGAQNDEQRLKALGGVLRKRAGSTANR